MTTFKVMKGGGAVPSVTSGGSSVQRSLSPQVSVVDVGAVEQQELAGQQRPLQTGNRR